MVHFSKVVTQYSSVPTFTMYVLTTPTLHFADAEDDGSGEEDGEQEEEGEEDGTEEDGMENA